MHFIFPNKEKKYIIGNCSFRFLINNIISIISSIELIDEISYGENIQIKYKNYKDGSYYIIYFDLIDFDNIKNLIKNNIRQS